MFCGISEKDILATYTVNHLFWYLSTIMHHFRTMVIFEVTMTPIDCNLQSCFPLSTLQNMWNFIASWQKNNMSVYDQTFSSKNHNIVLLLCLIHYKSNIRDCVINKYGSHYTTEDCLMCLVGIHMTTSMEHEEACLFCPGTRTGKASNTKCVLIPSLGMLGRFFILVWRKFC